MDVNSLRLQCDLNVNTNNALLRKRRAARPVEQQRPEHLGGEADLPPVVPQRRRHEDGHAVELRARLGHLLLRCGRHLHARQADKDDLEMQGAEEMAAALHAGREQRRLVPLDVPLPVGFLGQQQRQVVAWWLWWWQWWWQWWW